jgi:cytochrome c peroxidase
VNPAASIRSRFSRAGRVSAVSMFAGLPIALGTVLAVAWADLPPVPQPAENPITEPKRVLGKILFFDEQMSMSNTVACATCHVAGRNGTDPRLARNAGPDGILNTPDDRLASPGVIHADPLNNYVRDTTFGLNPQITGRAAPSPIDAAYAAQLFWDGRASGQFTDPQTGQTAIAAGGALESQSVNPPVSSVEMAHESIDWGQVTTKLARVRPLDLATNLPSDVASALTGGPNYPELFRRAFGDTQITASRIAFAIATYERTLIADQTPWDRFQAGQTNALTPGQQQGFQVLQAQCAVCHTPPFFTNQTFRNIGLRPTTEDPGRQAITGNTADRGKFKVPSLRNVNLQAAFMHNGQFATLPDVIRFYARAPGAPPQFPDNIDPAVPIINLPPQAAGPLTDFIANGLTDPRVAAQTFPFDRPTLFSERGEDHATDLGGGVPGSGGITPRIIVQDPAMVGNADFRVGLDGALGGATATLFMSLSAPAGGRIAPDRNLGSLIAGGSGSGQGLTTLHWPLNAGDLSGGQVAYLQWSVPDAAASGGQAFSNVARAPIFCGSGGCPAPCGYANCDASTTPPVLNIADFLCFQARFIQGDAYANCDGSTASPVLNIADFLCFQQRFAAGCP